MKNSPRASNRIGTVSLAIAASGFLVGETAHYFHLIQGPTWAVVRAGFEAALIGGIADWFAVTALFRPVPRGRWALPHTDIIVNNRQKLTDGVVDLVENQLLSPASVREKLQAFSMSRVLLEQFETQAGRDIAAATLSALAGHATAGLEDEKLRSFLTDLLREQIKTARLAPIFATWLEARLAAGDTRVLWQSIAATLADQAERGEFDTLFRDLIQTGLDAYKEELRGPGKFKGWFASAVIDAEKDGRRLRDGLTKSLREMAAADSHPMAARLDEAITNYAASLRSGVGAAAERMADFQERLATHPDLESVVGNMLGDLRRLTEVKLRNSRTEFEAALAGAIKRGISKLRADEAAQGRLDCWAREALGSVVTRHHGVIGATARESLNRLDDRELVAQLETKVGRDLQYIRLNGAVIGGLVGVCLMIGKLMLGSA